MTQTPAIDSRHAKALDALALLARDAAPIAMVWNAEVAAALRALSAAPSAPTTGILLPRGTRPGLAWHVDQLAALHGAGMTLSELEAARLRYHARLLGLALAPTRAEFRPLVSIVIPVYNRAGPVIEAVQSCIEQTWRPIEIVVVDDGSKDSPEAGLARFGDKVRLIRKPNGGVASARNLGIDLAQGDLVHFLDSDDLLTPHSVESKVAAFTALPDAELCYGQVQSIDMRDTPKVRDWRRRHYDDPAGAMIVSFPFLLQATMLPRWRLLMGPRFEEDLRRSSDFRFWQALGFAGAVAVGVEEVGTHFRRFHDSLHRTPETEDDSHALALMRSLASLIAQPNAWAHGADYLNILSHKRVHHWFDTAPSPRVAAAARAAVKAIAAIPRTSPSPLPMLAEMTARMEKLQREGAWPTQGPASFYRALGQAIRDARANGLAFREKDLAFWRRLLATSPKDRALAAFLIALDGAATPARQAKLADALLRPGQRPGQRLPSRRITRRAARLQRWIGTRLAVTVARATAGRG